MAMLKKLSIVSCLTLLLFCITSCREIENSPTPNSTVTQTKTEDITFSYNKALTSGFQGPESLFNSQVQYTPAKRIDVISLEIMLESLKIAQKKGWNGDQKSSLNIALTDYAPGLFENWVKRSQEKEEAVIITDDRLQFYTTDAAKQEIIDEVFKARREYIDYLKSKGVYSAYIEEIQTNTWPEDRSRFTYIAENDPNADLSGVLSIDGDKSKKKYILHDMDIYIPALIMKQSGVIGDEPTDPAKKIAYQKTLRDMGLRLTTYHEMTHILQTAVNQVNRPEGFKYPTIPIETACKISRAYNWGDIATVGVPKVKNADMNDEAHADGTSFEILVNAYNMSSIQQKIVWDYQFGRLENAAAIYDEIHSIFEKDYPSYDPFNLSSQIQGYEGITMEYVSTEREMLDKELNTVDFVAFGGYLHSMTPDEMPPCWEFLKTLHNEI